MQNEKAAPPLVSIVTPSFNQAKYIERTILSVANQDYPNIEHIVVDGGSKDGTLGILGKFSGLRYISEPDSGQTNAINKGLRMANGEIIGWLNSDDTYCPGAVKAAVEYLLSHPDVDLVYSNINIVDKEDKRIRGSFIFPYSQFVQLNVDNCIPQPSVFFRKGILPDVGFLDEKLNYVMDYEFWLRVGQKRKIAMMSGTYANFRIAKGTKTCEKYDDFFNEILSVNKKYGGFPHLWLAGRFARRFLGGLGLVGAARSVKNNLHRLAGR